VERIVVNGTAKDIFVNGTAKDIFVNGTAKDIFVNGTAKVERIVVYGTAKVEHYYFNGDEVTYSRLLELIAEKPTRQTEEPPSDLDTFKRLSELGYRRVEKVTIEYIKI
jgi:hypothetical protein